MNLQKGQNKLDCLLAAAAMVMDEPLEDLKKRIGHDGFEKVFPNSYEPYCYRGYHIQEIIDQAFLNGWAVINIEVSPNQVSFLGNDKLFKIPINENRLNVYLNKFPGIIAGVIPGVTAHASAWDNKSKQIFDPAGEVYKLKDYKLQIVEFWAFSRF